MLDQSMLTKDRRVESILLVVTVLLFLCEHVLYMVDQQFVGWLLRPNLVLGASFGLWVVILNFTRILRLRKARSVWFSLGLLKWTLLFICASMAQLWPLALEYGDVLALFLVLLTIVGLIGRRKKSRFFHEFGWPILKHVHWLLILPLVIGAALQLLAADQIFLFGNISTFIVARYAYNRWIYAADVVYPFKPTGAKFFIRQRRQVPKSKAMAKSNVQ